MLVAVFSPLSVEADTAESVARQKMELLLNRLTFELGKLDSQKIASKTVFHGVSRGYNEYIFLSGYPLTYTDEIDEILDALMKQESGGNPKAENWNDAKITGYPSLGCYQFQPPTWKKYTKLYGITGDIYDCKLQRAVARRMLEDDWNNWNHWKTSWNLLRLPKSRPQTETHLSLL